MLQPRRDTQCESFRPGKIWQNIRVDNLFFFVFVSTFLRTQLHRFNFPLLLVTIGEFFVYYSKLLDQKLKWNERNCQRENDCNSWLEMTIIRRLKSSYTFIVIVWTGYDLMSCQSWKALRLNLRTHGTIVDVMKLARWPWFERKSSAWRL